MKIALTTDQERLVQEMVDSGRFVSPSEVLDEAIALLRARERSCSQEVAELNAKIEEGLEALQRSESVAGEKAFLDLRRRGEERARQQSPATIWLRTVLP